MTSATTVRTSHTITRTRAFVLTLTCPDRPGVVRAFADVAGPFGMAFEL
jgi:hypothetical protein